MENKVYMSYEDEEPIECTMEDLHRLFDENFEEQKLYGTTFETWLDEMVKMQIFIRK